MTDDSARPNVVLVITDDQGYGDLGCTGNPWLRTPAIDGLAAESLRCEDFHVQPMCTPTRAALMTGRRPLRNGAWATCWGRSLLKLGQRTLGEVFADGGYRTGYFGKWHLGDTFPYRPQDRGFQDVVAHKGGGVGQVPDFWGNNYFDDVYFRNGEPRPYSGYCTDVWFDEAGRFIAESGEEPFLCVIATNAPHSPYLVEERYEAPYREMGAFHPAFYGMIANIDENVGALRRSLAERDLGENTILIFMTDNGTCGGCRCRPDGHLHAGYNGGMRGMKGSYYDGGHRVPFFLHWPAGGLAGGRTCKEMCLDIDLLPTLAGCCGLTPPTDIDGVDLGPVWRGERELLDEDRTHAIVYHQGTEPPTGERSCLMTRRWRLIDGQELYDSEVDPGQHRDVAGDHPEVVAQLRRSFADWWEGLVDDLPAYAPLVIGHAAENPTRLDAMDVTGDMVWQQAEVATGSPTAGRWQVAVDRPGRYRFALYRWPPELELAIDEGISPDACAALLYPKAGRCCTMLAPVTARVALHDVCATVAVASGDRAAIIELDVPNVGTGELTAQFGDRDGGCWGAYYVVIERVAALPEKLPEP